MKGDALDITAFDDPGQYYAKRALRSPVDESIWDQYNVSKVASTEEINPMRQSMKSSLETYFAPGERQRNAALFTKYPEMFEGASSLPKQYTSGAATVIGGK